MPSAVVVDVVDVDSKVDPGAVDDAHDHDASSITSRSRDSARAGPSQQKSEMHTATHEIVHTLANEVFQSWLWKILFQTHVLCLSVLRVLYFVILCIVLCVH